MSRITGVIAALMVVMGLVAAVASAGTSTGRLAGPFCISKKSGTVRSVPKTTPCKKGEVRKTGVRAVAGPQGPKGDAGSAGPQGPKGDAGAAGAAGAAGVSGYEVDTWRYSKDDANSDMGPGYVGVGGGAIATVACSPGKVALGGGYRFTSPEALANGSGVVASFPGRMDWTTNTVKPDRNDGWIVQVNDSVQLADLTLYVICANVA